MTKQYAIPCENLLLDAQRVFGFNLVTQAWHIRPKMSPDTVKDLKALNTDKESYTSPPLPEINLSVGREIMLEFLNGRKVLFNTSEWGAIQLTEAELTYLDPQPKP